MAEPWDWEESDLEALVQNGAMESLELDFKRCDAIDVSSEKRREKSKKELSKDISAFANSAGGTLVYGIVEEKHVAMRLDDGFDPSQPPKEWIDQVMNSTIRPRLNGVRIKPVQLNTARPGKVAYVVAVPQSTTAHQASDKRYYKRFNFESVPMEDYEIRDVMHRALEPRVSVLATHEGRDKGELKFQEREDGVFTSPKLMFYVSNEPGAAVAEYLQAQIFVSDTVQVTQGAGQPSGTVVHLPGGKLTYHYREHVISPGDVPLFSGERRMIDGLSLMVPGTWQNDLPLPLILWRTRANNMNPRVGAVVFNQIVAGYWRFELVSTNDLPEGYVAEFAP